MVVVWLHFGWSQKLAQNTLNLGSKRKLSPLCLSYFCTFLLHLRQILRVVEEVIFFPC